MVFTLVMQGNLYAQSGNGKISGIVVDASTKKPIEFATVALLNPDTGKPVDGGICDARGRFTISKLSEGKYSLSVSFMGYDTREIKDIIISRDKNSVELPPVLLNTSAKLLEEITVEAQKELIEERVDRTIYNAELDDTAKGGDATDVLRRVPMLSVDLDGNLSMRGNQNVTVLINNKPSSIMAASVADALRQIPADQIKSVEVITSPSARYDAEGSAGVINIVTKKNTLQGLSLNIDSGVGIRGSNLGLNGGYRKGKLGLTLGGWGRSQYNVTGAFDNEQLTTNTDGTQIFNTQRAETRNQRLFGSYTFGMDYDFNEKNYIIGSVRFGARNSNVYQDGLFTQSFINNALTNSSLRNVQVSDLSGTVDVNFNYTKLFDKPQQEFSILGLYSRNKRNNDFLNQILDENTNDITSRVKNLNDSYNHEIAFQADYQKPINKNQMIEVGVKETLRRVISDFDFQVADGATGPYVSVGNGRLNNSLNYDQNVTAGYFSYTYNTQKSYSFKTGVRYEYTIINANFQDQEDIEIPNYGVLVPSINISKRLKNGNFLKAAYNRRIQRPSLVFLNPNIQASNPLNITIGNPELEPEFTNNFELSYNTRLKGAMLNFSAFARNTGNAIQRIRDIEGLDTIRTTFRNIGLENAYGLSIFSNVNLSQKFTMNGGGDVYYATLTNNDPNPLFNAANEGWVANVRGFGSYKINDNWALQFFGFYRARQVQLQGFQGGFGIYSLSVRKDLKNKKGSYGMGIENFFATSIRVRNELSSPVFDQRSVNRLDNIGARVNFSYRIGKMDSDPNPRRKRRTITSDDLKDGGSSDMGGGGMEAQPAGGNGSGGRGRPQTGQGQRPAPSKDEADKKPAQNWGQGENKEEVKPKQPENKEEEEELKEDVPQKEKHEEPDKQ
ncbi:MAG: TonB-dependent receptor [Cyclobacteriaceae bacterium]|nr:TonB-dependent receptor [Cyclobacteriaceae bacterium]